MPPKLTYAGMLGSVDHRLTGADIARRYLEAVQAARRGDLEQWDAVDRLIAPDFEVRIAGHDGRSMWAGVRTRAQWLERLRGLRWDQLQTETVSLFGDESRAVAEQVSRFVEDGVELAKPVCFVFDT